MCAGVEGEGEGEGVSVVGGMEVFEGALALFCECAGGSGACWF